MGNFNAFFAFAWALAMFYFIITNAPFEYFALSVITMSIHNAANNVERVIDKTR